MAHTSNFFARFNLFFQLNMDIKLLEYAEMSEYGAQSSFCSVLVL